MQPQINTERLVTEWKRAGVKGTPKIVSGTNSFGDYTEAKGSKVTVREYHKNKHSLFRDKA